MSTADVPMGTGRAGATRMIKRDEPILQSRNVQEGYDQWSHIYDHEGNPLIALEEPVMIEALGSVEGLAILDLGCGTGRHALRLAAGGARVSAVDFSEGMLEVARQGEGAHRVDFRVHDLSEPLPWADATFDGVVSGLVLEHLADLAGFFGEARRVLKPGGRAVISAMHPAMFLLGKQAQFSDPATGVKVRPGSIPHQIGAFILAALGAGFQVEGIRETAPDTDFIALNPRAAKYLDWPMLLVLELRAPSAFSPGRP